MSPASEAHDKSYRVDETYIKVKGHVKYLHRAVDSTGQTIDFLFQKVWSCSSNPIPRVINVDKNPAYPAALNALKHESVLPRFGFAV